MKERFPVHTLSMHFVHWQSRKYFPNTLSFSVSNVQSMLKYCVFFVSQDLKKNNIYNTE